MSSQITLQKIKANYRVRTYQINPNAHPYVSNAVVWDMNAYRSILMHGHMYDSGTWSYFGIVVSDVTPLTVSNTEVVVELTGISQTTDNPLTLECNYEQILELRNSTGKDLRYVGVKMNQSSTIYNLALCVIGEVKDSKKDTTDGVV